MDRKDKRFTVTLAPNDYRFIRDHATARYQGDSERTAIVRWLEKVIEDEVRQIQEEESNG